MRWNLLGGLTALSLAAPAVGQEAPAVRLETEGLRWEIGADGRTRAFVDRLGNVDYLAAPSPCATATIAGQSRAPIGARFRDGLLTLDFGQGVEADLKITARPRYLVVEVAAVRGAIEQLNYLLVPLKLKGDPTEPFAACALALNLQSRIAALPGFQSSLNAAAFPRTGLTGAATAVLGCPSNQLRELLQQVVSEAPELPKSPIGGPWALESKNNLGSYLFNFGDLSEATADAWIEVARSLGITQIDFHGGRSFRFGDCQPDPQTYPNGIESFKAVIDKLHAAGILAGLHTYAFFIDKRTPWVTPVPDPRLAKDATFTLASALDGQPADRATVEVTEPTNGMSAVTGFNVRNSVTLQIDDELITYTGVSATAPFRFTGCKRGAWGTKIAAHAAGAKVQHLRECFGLFVPDGDSTLLTEVAARTAELYNRAGFDMIYLDALDGEDVIAGREWGWHYGGKFVHELWKRLERPAIMEMSTFHHLLWPVRSRIGAWDHPNRSHKQFIDLHVANNERQRARIFIPGHLGWWSFKTWTGAAGEPTFPDDIEYLCAKALASDTGLSIMGINPGNVGQVPALPRLAAIVRQYESLRHEGYFDAAVKARLREPKQEFTLTRQGDRWGFRPISYQSHRVAEAEATWTVTNRYDAQPAGLRIEALLSAGGYEAPDNPLVAAFTAPAEFGAPAAAPKIEAALTLSASDAKAGGTSAVLAATNRSGSPTGSWCRWTKTFDPPLNLKAHQGLGLWVHGDGQGEVLNVQLTSPSHLSHGIGDHYLTIDFTGWRYLELIEPEGARHADYTWPHGGLYAIYREAVRPESIATVSLYLNNLPPNKPVEVRLSPIRALPIAPTPWSQPAVTISGQTIRFPVTLAAGQVIEARPGAPAALYDPSGKLLEELTPEGELPGLAAGPNAVGFACRPDPAARPRARVTVISQGTWFGNQTP